MSTKPSVQPMPRERAPAQYQEQNEQRYRSQVDEELAQKFDKRSNLVLGRGKSLVLSSPGGLAFTLSLNDDGIITVTDTAGNTSEILLQWDTLDGRPANLAALTGTEDINNALVWGGANLAQDAGFRGGTTYWSAVGSSGSHTLSGNVASSIRYGQASATGMSAGANFRISGAGQRTVPVVAGDNVEIGCLVGGTSGLAFLCRVYWYNAAGSLLSASNAASQTLSLAGGGDVSTYHLVQGFATAPANAAWATPAFYATSTPGGTANIRVAGPFIAQARIGQTAVTRLEINNDYVPGADPTATGTAAGIASQGTQATANAARGTLASRPAAPPEGSWYVVTDSTPQKLTFYSSGAWTDVANLATAGTVNDKTVTKQNLDLDIDTSGTTWIVGPTFDMTVGTPGYLSVPNSYISAAVTAAISAGSTFNGNWRITEATQAAPSTKTVVASGTFVADSGGGSVEVSGYVSPLTPVLATYSGACRYTLEVQRASGTNNVTNLTGLLALTWTPSG